ncbi:branched-chain amino acid ABC transporter substrate-binding protein [Ralstonia pickettii]|uniref:Leucine-, isoleucine-, valine-, threonine-, and alanine-binding protein n=4 Tax=Pseudomonadota TaxID=1224 RepID=A0AAD2BU34_9RALS|nr:MULTISPECIES: branched-chain amino acid ABC transporter substrate-binding protein [Ralstonia]MBN6210609.1 branched-chain amino acid ABC transporter substrate-binding protein [Ralstonia pickettii]PLC41385.1 branched-chain amino acid ABC transporter substrate-binding protein [Ralstonia pickettii]CAJ0849837.1 Leucine-, isoleucine-, valine-, threonine-, and alanine-binding protein [Ralstonia sp. LMG 32965]CAJ0856401.1 Leucine-, isoleucine-, valine-, threonine-, and alanine-binding protein [Ralst
MQIKFAKVLPLAAAVALVAACGKNEEKPADQAAAPAATSAPAAAAGGGETVIKIGHAAPLTGGIAHLGKDNENGARLAVEEANKEGLTIDGKKIKLELVGEDDAGDPKTGTAVAQKLVDEHVVAVVGHLNSGVSIPASKIYSDAGIVQISPSSTNPDYTKQGFKTTYRVVATDAQQGPALANYAAKTLGAKTVAIVDDATAYGKGLADEFEKTAKAGGVNVVAREATNDKATDFKAILTKIKGKKPDVIMYGGMDATGGPFAKQAKELGITAKIVGGDGVCTDKVAELAGDAIDNIVCSEAGLALSKMEKGADFEKKYQARFNTPVQIYAPFTYDAVNVIIDAMKRANSTDAAKILAAMPATNYNGVIGNIAFDDKGDLKQGSITLYNYKDKKKSVLDVVKM